MSSQPDQATSISKDYDWLLFASVILGIAGLMRIFDGIWAFGFDGEVPSELEGALLGTSMSTYGWLWIIVGAVSILSSFAIMYSATFARWIGIFAGALLAITAIWWIPFFPVWSFVYITMGMVVVYAAAEHAGRDNAR